MIATSNPDVKTARRPREGGRRFPLHWIGALPFLLYVGLFLLLPTVIVVVGAFAGKDGPTLSNITELNQEFVLNAFVSSLLVSTASAVVGAVAGALLAYAVVTGNPRGVLRRVVTSASGVLAQFGGVTLAFAFIATIGSVGFVTLWLQDRGLNIYANGVWLTELPGLVLVYTYFQIPLMVLVFLPALDGIRPQWREATESLGGGTWHYWRYVAGPLLAPAFLGATLLLFANSFSAYATANALINQGQPVISQQINGALSGEVGSFEPGFAKAIAVEMVIIVTLVTVVYSLLQRRTSRWLQ